MKKIKISIILLFIIIYSEASSQKISVENKDINYLKANEKKIILDTCVFVIEFRQTTVSDINNRSKKKENYMVLQIGKHISKYSDYLLLKRDSLSEAMTKEKKNSSEIMNKLLPLSKGTSTLNIFKNYPNGKITSTDRIPLGETYKFSENKEKPVWRIGKETIKICGYDCTKAQTTFRGRNYTAWFASKITISDGPWKFWGLPGLILKIIDDKSEYSFECMNIEKPKRAITIYLLDRSYITTTKAKFNKALKIFNENPSASIQASGMIKNGLPENIKSRPYNPIELSE